MEIRFEEDRDHRAISVIHRQAFGQEAEPRLVEALRENQRYGEGQSLVAEEFGMLLGHVLFSDLKLVGADGRAYKAAALAPVGVRPECQKQGVGSALIKEGLMSLGRMRYEVVVVLGEPEYYARFGFSQALGEKISCEYSGPYLMALELIPGVLDGATRLTCEYAPEFAHLE